MSEIAQGIVESIRKHSRTHGGQLPEKVEITQREWDDLASELYPGIPLAHTRVNGIKIAGIPVVSEPTHIR